MFRFTIRDLLWLMVVAALAVALWNAHRIALIREADITEREASIAHREESLKSDVRWLTSGNRSNADSRIKIDDLLYYPPDPNDL
jgi:hypothetical protein